MKGWSFFLHSVKLVFRNLQEALQIGLVPSVIMAFLIALIFSQSGLSMGQISGDAAVDLVESQAEIRPGWLFLGGLVWGLITLWIFVAWHRFVLLEEYPKGWVPPLHFDRMLGYFGRGFMIIVLIAVIGLAASLISALLGPLGVVVMIAVWIFLIVLFYRLSVVLPAVAIGRPMSFGDAWRATEGSTGAILLLVVIMAIVQLGLQVVFGVAISILPILGIAVQVIVTLIFSLINVSILTTLYGHYIEGRALD